MEKFLAYLIYPIINPPESKGEGYEARLSNPISWLPVNAEYRHFTVKY